MIPRQPVFFLAHGDPMNALRDNTFTRSLTTLGNSLDVKPSAVVMISAHWLSRGTFVSATDPLETIHDFGGFPDELYQVTYPARGLPGLAERIASMIPDVRIDGSRGLDHGAWTVLKHLFPNADIPIVSLSIEYGKPQQSYIDIGEILRPLRDENILIIGSGNIAHNVGMYFSKDSDEPFDWAVSFDTFVRDSLIAKDIAALINYESLKDTAHKAHPTNDHLLPLFHTLGASYPEDPVAFTYEEVVRSMSMRCVRFG